MVRYLRSLLILLSLLALCQCTPSHKSTTYTIGIDPMWYPLELGGIEKNMVAFSVELLVEIAKYEKLQLAVLSLNWDNLYLKLRSEKVDAVLSSLRPYSFYQKTYSFSDPFLMTGPVLIVPKKSKVDSLSQLKGKEIGVVRGSPAALVLETTPGVLFQGYDTIGEALNALNDEQVEAAAIEVLIGQDYVRNLYSSKLKVTGHPLTEDGLRLVTLFERDKALVKSFDRGLAALKKNGTYSRLLKKWGLSPEGAPMANLDRELELILQSLR